MLVWLVDDHPCGWAELHARRRDCRALTFTNGEPFVFMDETFARGDDGSAEWVYAFDVEQKRLYIRDARHKEGAGFIDLTASMPAREERALREQKA